jgi:hypothetical protein
MLDTIYKSKVVTDEKIKWNKVYLEFGKYHDNGKSKAYLDIKWEGCRTYLSGNLLDMFNMFKNINTMEDFYNSNL